VSAGLRNSGQEWFLFRLKHCVKLLSRILKILSYGTSVLCVLSERYIHKSHTSAAGLDACL
jgi:hypothetical protein